ncbi:MAG: sulfite exporter TauE/SafE family protein [Oligoflexia bacterium]|nr:sulfite exporter TauE/SafE family protein [Oligoflexia bacterium]
MIIYSLYILAGIFAGYVGGLLAVGAGILLVPFLTLIGFSPAQAVGGSLVAVFMSSLTSAFQI